MSDPSTPDRGRRPAGTMAVGSLWVLGVVVTILSLAAIVYSQLAYASNYATTSFSSRPTNLLVAGFTGTLGAAALPGGMVCLGLALAVTALRSRLPERSVDRADAEPEAGPDADVALLARSRSDLRAPVAAEEAPRGAIDPAVFRRPSSGSRA